jgi:CBS domain containing-hemolysin-like protein
MSITEVFSDIAEVIARMNPQEVVRLKAPQLMSDRVEQLINKKKEGVISLEEASELERFLALDLFISLTKARARMLLV